jgi:hypothetical protein
MQQEFQAKEQYLQSIIQKMMADIEKLEKAQSDKAAQIQADLLKTKMKTDAEMEKAHLDNAHELGMAAHSHTLENNPAIAETINDLAVRMAQLEQALNTISAPAPTAENPAPVAESEGISNVNVNA